MNAVSRPDPDPERARREMIARHMRNCHELVTLGSALAEVAAYRALNQASIPDVPGAPGPDYCDLFIRLTDDVRRTMMLRQQLAAGAETSMMTARRPKQQPQDPRRDVLRRAFDLFTAYHPDRRRLRRRLQARIDKDLAADHACAIKTMHILQIIADDFGVVPDFSQCPDALVERLTGQTVAQPIPGQTDWDPVAWFIRDEPPPARD